MANIKHYAPKTGRVLREDGSTINTADLAITEDVFAKTVTLAEAETVVELAERAVDAVTLKAPDSNTGNIKLWDNASPDADEYFPLEPGEAISFAISNLNQVHVSADQANDVIHYLAVK